MEDYVTYEQAVRLKELGFDWECLYYYQQDELCENTRNFIDEEEICISIENLLVRHNIEYPGNYIYSAPTLAQATKWLREVKRLFINIWRYRAKYGWSLEKTDSCDNTYIDRCEDDNLFVTYESALSAGIDRALELIEKMEYGNKKHNTHS